MGNVVMPNGVHNEFLAASLTNPEDASPQTVTIGRAIAFQTSLPSPLRKQESRNSRASAFVTEPLIVAAGFQQMPECLLTSIPNAIVQLTALTWGQASAPTVNPHANGREEARVC